MLDKVVNEFSTPQEKKDLRKSTAALVITQMQEMGADVRERMAIRHEKEQARWISANPTQPQDDTSPGWKTMTDRQLAEINQNFKVWGIPEQVK